MDERFTGEERDDVEKRLLPKDPVKRLLFSESSSFCEKSAFSSEDEEEEKDDGDVDDVDDVDPVTRRSCLTSSKSWKIVSGD